MGDQITEMRKHIFIVAAYTRRAAAFSAGVVGLSALAFSSVAGPVARDSAATATTTVAPTAAPAPESAMPISSVPVHLANNPVARLRQQSFTVVESVGINIKPNSKIDIQRPIVLRKNETLVLKSSSGELIEIDGPYRGKPIDHYTLLSQSATMGYDAQSFGGRNRCSGASGVPHPSGGPNPDETGGAENQATHCK